VKLSNIKAYHLSVEHDIKTDELIYDRKLKEGTGEKIYGITVAKSIIKDKEFIDLALEIKNELLSSHGTMMTGKTSKYNSAVFIHACQLCGKSDTNDLIGPLQTHHINHQKDCTGIGEFAVDKPHVQKNDKANLIVVCAECHLKIHKDGMDLEGYVMTSNGRKVTAKIVKDKDKDKDKEIAVTKNEVAKH
jgi:DNA mismatch repair protein MutS